MEEPAETSQLEQLGLADHSGMDNQGFWFWLRSARLPSTEALREDPRFFAAVADLGLVELWEAQGYPAGFRSIERSDGRLLDCAEFPK